MGLSVITYARNQRLTTRAQVAAAVSFPSSVNDFIDFLIDSVSGPVGSIAKHCRRPFPRETYRELIPGFGENTLQLARTPIAQITAVAFDGSALTDYAIEDPIEGSVYRQVGWGWTAQVQPGLTRRGKWPGFGHPIARSEEPLFRFDYLGGYFVPDDKLTATTLSAAAADNSFNDSASGFTDVRLVAGDRVVSSGWATAANNGTFTLVSRANGKLAVSGGVLVDEAAGPSVTISYRSLPGDIEMAAIETVKSWYLSRKDDSNVIEKALGPARLRFSEELATEELPAAAAMRLRRWVRQAA